MSSRSESTVLPLPTPVPDSGVQPMIDPHSPAVAENYRYWQEHGGEWGDEYDRRKHQLIMLHIQELMLAEYMTHNAPARVLEFGCGVGRHLRYLSRIPGIDVYGFDQSPTMIGQCARWADPEWSKSHLSLGPPVGRLPYRDGEFDIVYTAEVLIHVRPTDLPGILGELIRVCRGHLLHLEVSRDFQVSTNEHDGCWNHDLEAVYAQLGFAVETLPQGFVSQTPRRVVIGPPPKYTWSPVTLGLFRRMEADLQHLIAERDQARIAVESLTARIAETEATIRNLVAERGALEQRISRMGLELQELRANKAALEHQLADLRRAAIADQEQLALLESTLTAERGQALRLASERERFVQQALEALRRVRP